MEYHRDEKEHTGITSEFAGSESPDESGGSFKNPTPNLGTLVDSESNVK